MKNKHKVVTFDKSALKFICKSLDVPYDKNIIAFVDGKVYRNIFELIEEKGNLEWIPEKT